MDIRKMLITFATLFLVVNALHSTPTEEIQSSIPDMDPAVITLDDQQKADYLGQLKSPQVLALRSALNAYTAGIEDDHLDEFAITRDNDFPYRFGLDSFEKSYFQHKMVLLEGERNEMGGLNFHIIPQGPKDTIFCAWMFNVGGSNWMLRAIWESPLSQDKQLLQRTLKLYAPFISSDEFGF